MSRSSSGSEAEQYSPYNIPTEASLATRRPSWTPSLPGDNRSKRRSRHQDENSHLSHEWSGSVPALLKARRPSYAPLANDPAQRARKPRVEVEQSPEQLKNVSGLPESPEEGKVFQASWEINVKDLVGDAVGNVSLILMVDNFMLNCSRR